MDYEKMVLEVIMAPDERHARIKMVRQIIYMAKAIQGHRGVNETEEDVVCGHLNEYCKVLTKSSTSDVMKRRFLRITHTYKDKIDSWQKLMDQQFAKEKVANGVKKAIELAEWIAGDNE